MRRDRCGVTDVVRVCGLGVVVQSPDAVTVGVVNPSRVNLDMNFQVDVAFQHIGEFFAGLDPDGFNGLPAFTENNFAMPVFGDIDNLVHFGAAIIEFFPVFRFNRQVIRQFLMEAVK